MENQIPTSWNRKGNVSDYLPEKSRSRVDSDTQRMSWEWSFALPSPCSFRLSSSHIASPGGTELFFANSSDTVLSNSLCSQTAHMLKPVPITVVKHSWLTESWDICLHWGLRVWGTKIRRGFLQGKSRYYCWKNKDGLQMYVHIQCLPYTLDHLNHPRTEELKQLVIFWPCYFSIILHPLGFYLLLVRWQLSISHTTKPRVLTPHSSVCF